MSKLKTKLADYNKETGTTTFIYAYKDQLFEGVAQCHEDDMDMNSELVGLKYAETRAFYKFIKYRKKELLLRLETLEGFLRNALTSKDFNITSSYGKKLQQAICDTRCELHDCKEGIENIPGYLKTDIAAREELYKRIRKRRKDAK